MWVKRTGVVFIITVLLMFALTMRVFYISFGVMNDEIQSVAGGRSKTITLYNSKGIIYDRNMVALSGNQFSYYLVINPRGFDKSNTDYICQITDISYEELTEKLTSESVIVLKSFNKPEDIPGVYVFEGTSRYGESSAARHLLGYLDSDSIVGLSGVEKAYDSELSLFKSSTTLTYSTNALQGAIDGMGMFVEAKTEPSASGLVLTLDKQLSETAKTIMSKYISSGALVILDANTGEILTILSSPDFDPERIQDYIDSDNSELVNKAVSNQSVGSVFKIVMAASAYLNNLQNFEYECLGGIEIGGRVFSCQNNKKHGNQNLEEAFANSCNSYFIALGQLLGYDAIIETAQLFGIDSKIKLCKELYSASGKLPSQTGTQSTANLSIGQGQLMISPLQIARITAAICNGGYLVNPTVYHSMYIDNMVTNKSEYKFKAQILSSDIADEIKKLCISCVENGTGKNARPYGTAGGKTASAQTGKYDSDGEEILNTYFTGFYPAEQPEYVITVFAENGKSGSETCAPVFREICNYIFENY